MSSRKNEVPADCIRARALANRPELSAENQQVVAEHLESCATCVDWLKDLPNLGRFKGKNKVPKDPK